MRYDSRRVQIPKENAHTDAPCWRALPLPAVGLGATGQVALRSFAAARSSRARAPGPRDRSGGRTPDCALAMRSLSSLTRLDVAASPASVTGLLRFASPRTAGAAEREVASVPPSPSCFRIACKRDERCDAPSTLAAACATVDRSLEADGALGRCPFSSAGRRPTLVELLQARVHVRAELRRDAAEVELILQRRLAVVLPHEAVERAHRRLAVGVFAVARAAAGLRSDRDERSDPRRPSSERIAPLDAPPLRPAADASVSSVRVAPSRASRAAGTARSEGPRGPRLLAAADTSASPR